MKDRWDLDAALAAEMSAWEAAGLRRSLQPARRRSNGQGNGGAESRADFTSNDYLGLAQHPAVIAAAGDALERYGAGGRASRMLGGGCALDFELENAMAEWLGEEAALLFPTGYHANLGLLSALVGPGDVVFSDARNHASIVDAARLARARVCVHRHLDLDELGRLLNRARTARRRLVITEGIFSMDGDAAPLAELHELCARHDALLVVDEAHALGLRGPNGAGMWSTLDRPREEATQLVARVITGGKALGVSGALVVGSAALREHLINRARTLMFTTALSPAVVGALLAAQRVCRSAPDLRLRTRDCAERIARRFELAEPAGAIVPIVIGEERAAMAAEEQLRQLKLEVRAVRPPTVAKGSSRLRVVCHAYNTEDEVERLERALASVAIKKRETVQAQAAPSGETPRSGAWLTVCGTDTGVGKTVVSALICRGSEARYFKPVLTGSEDDRQTVLELASLSADDAAETAFHFQRPASPDQAARAEGAQVHPDQIDARLRGERERGRRLVVELAGGLAVPWTEELTQLDWLAAQRAPLVLVARSGLGTLNHTLLSLEALAARHLRPRALFLVGEPHAENRATLASKSELPTYEVPVFDPLGPAALDGWLERNDLEPLWG